MNWIDLFPNVKSFLRKIVYNYNFLHQNLKIDNTFLELLSYKHDNITTDYFLERGVSYYLPNSLCLKL